MEADPAGRNAKYANATPSVSFPVRLSLLRLRDAEEENLVMRFRTTAAAICICCIAGGSAGAVKQVATGRAGMTLEGRVYLQQTSEAVPQANLTLIQLHPELPLTIEAISEAQEVAVLMASPGASSPGFIDGFLLPTAQHVNVPPNVLRPLSVRTAVGDGSGRFSFGELQPGPYCLTAQKDGYLDPLIGGYSGSSVPRVIVVGADASPKFQQLAMLRASSISGRILDSQGQPVSRASVSAYQLRYPDGRQTWNAPVSRITNDRGEFRLFGLAPGEYFIGATPRSREALTASATETYFPGSTNPSQAKPFRITDGSDVQDVNFILQMPSERTYTISGVVTNALPDRLLNQGRGGTANRSIQQFHVVPLESSVLDSSLYSNVAAAEARGRGEFEIHNVKPGTYDLYPDYLNISALRSFTQRTRIEVKNSDVSGISITLSPGATLTAQAIIDGQGAVAFKLDSLSLNLSTLGTMPKEFASYLRSQSFDANGRLRTENVAEGRYSIAVAGLPSSGFVEDILQEGKSIFDEGVQVAAEMPPVQIHVRLNGPTIRGTVRTAQDQPAGYVSVILVPRSERRNNRALYKVVSSDADGNFAIQGVMPENYSLFAIRNRPSGQPWLNADFIEQFENQALPIVLKSDTSQATIVELTVLN